MRLTLRTMLAYLDEILERHDVAGLLNVTLKLETTKRKVRAYADQPARIAFAGPSPGPRAALESRQELAGIR